MLTQLLAGLTRDQKHALADLGIPHSRISEWKSGKRKPTLAQILVLAMVANTDPKPLVTWLAEQEANPAQLDMFRKVQERGSWALLTAVFAVALATPDPAFAQCSSGQSGFEPLSQGNAHCRINPPASTRAFGLARPISQPC
ncbi:helix-turn-helix transcriptional regulator [Pelomonas sp. APW6]|uniref:Helix-turn-helix transcriptional regulator n=1 Tax=Roseateles subflavus TaxID=3053353 RepID=A0ABT7LP49_9BURK|nr:helix-turn-helix transcriptional regulator [Pelomonas sp. APW6]MDL5034657.1 helix-turn-helix transcriptional regulator [Pelomonas sp. APW6]